MHATQNTAAHSTLLTLLRYSLYQRYPPYSRYVFYSLHYSAPTSQYHPTSPYISLYLNQCADLTFMVMPITLTLVATQALRNPSLSPSPSPKPSRSRSRSRSPNSNPNPHPHPTPAPTPTPAQASYTAAFVCTASLLATASASFALLARPPPLVRCSGGVSTGVSSGPLASTTRRRVCRDESAGSCGRHVGGRDSGRGDKI